MRLLNHKFIRNRSAWAMAGVLLLLLSAFFLLWSGRANSIQSVNAVAAQVYFDGDYRIGDGPWQKIVPGEHIPATQADVTLRGNFHLRSPGGEYVGVYTGNTHLAFYTNHINLTFYESGREPYQIDHEHPLFGISACGTDWTAHSFSGDGTEPIEILIHNPHRFGNEMAIDQLLSNIALWGNIDFEKGVLNADNPQRNTGIFFVIVAFVLLGTALFSSLIHTKTSGIIWLFGLVILFAGAYFLFSVDGVSFWQESVVTNTTILGCSMMLYMLFLSMVVVHFLKETKKAGTVTIAVMCVLDLVFQFLPIVTSVFFYDTWHCWAMVQMAANLVLLGCLCKELFRLKGADKWIHLALILPLIAYITDVIMTYLGIWQGGIASECAFCILFVLAMVTVLRIIPRNINAAAKAKELEAERNSLNAQLAESRISTMMSQIRPHFIYNTLGSIAYLCEEDPPKAKKLVHSFASYLRGNFRELDSPRPISMSQEMDHVRHYLSIEKVRFPDMTFQFETNTTDFMLPALTIQPIVENAIKHGLMPLDHGGRICVRTWDTDTHHCVSVEDDGVGFDPNILLDERKHIGIRNIRGRLETMVNGTLEIESTIGKGTKVQIKIPKDADRK